MCLTVDSSFQTVNMAQRKAKQKEKEHPDDITDWTGVNFEVAQRLATSVERSRSCPQRLTDNGMKRDKQTDRQKEREQYYRVTPNPSPLLPWPCSVR